MLKLGAAFSPFYHGASVGKHIVKEAAPCAAQPVSGLSALAYGKAGVISPLGDIPTATLDKVCGERVAQRTAYAPFGYLGQLREFRIQKTQKVMEGGVIARMRRRGEKDHTSFGDALSQALEELITLVARVGVGADAGVGLIDDYEFRAGAQEVMPDACPTLM